MFHHFGILDPSRRAGRGDQKPFFGGGDEDDLPLTRAERQEAILASGLLVDPPETEDEERPRFVTLHLPPYY